MTMRGTTPLVKRDHAVLGATADRHPLTNAATRGMLPRSISGKRLWLETPTNYCGAHSTH